MLKNLSIRLKITLWYALALFLVIITSIITLITVSTSVITKSLQDNLVDMVVHNMAEIRYVEENDPNKLTSFNQYIEYKEGYLEFSKNFLTDINGVSTSVYDSDKEIIYGKNPIPQQSFVIPMNDMKTQQININGVKHYIFDKKLEGDKLDGLWVRGIIPETKGQKEISEISSTLYYVFPIIFVISILGGYLFIKRILKPIQKVTKTAHDIEQSGNLKKRIDNGNGGDEAHQLARTFNQMIEKIDTAFETQKRFTSDASHELRTPTSVILAQSEFHLEKDRTTDEYKKALTVINRQSNKMANIIKDMLDYTRLEMKSQDYVKENINLSRLVESTSFDLSSLREKNISLKSKVEDNIFILANKELISRLLVNIINNAYRYGVENGNILVSLFKKGEKIILSVKDDGLGIAEKDIENIFERFYQADASRRTIGTGLGLPMVKKIVEFHNAQIDIKSKLGEGSEFIVTFQ